MTTRRTFIFKTLPGVALAVTASQVAFAEAAKLEESDPAAAALGYKHDATKVDAKKYPTHAAGNICAGCQLYQGKATDPWAPCGVMGGKQVNAKGWCVAYVKKA